jgi:hypothetical protein
MGRCRQLGGSSWSSCLEWKDTACLQELGPELPQHCHCEDGQKHSMVGEALSTEISVACLEGLAPYKISFGKSSFKSEQLDRMAKIQQLQNVRTAELLQRCQLLSNTKVSVHSQQQTSS